jgi:hypothetical protein
MDRQHQWPPGGFLEEIARQEVHGVVYRSGYCFNAGEWNFSDAPLRGVYPRDEVYAGVRSWESFEPWPSRIGMGRVSMTSNAWSNNLPPPAAACVISLNCSGHRVENHFRIGRIPRQWLFDPIADWGKLTAVLGKERDFSRAV